MFRPLRSVVLLALLICLRPALHGQVPGEPRALFVEVDGAISVSAPLQDGAFTERSRRAGILAAPLLTAGDAPVRLSLGLFSDITVVAQVTCRRGGSRPVECSGGIEDQPESSVVLIGGPAQFAGSVVGRDGMFDIVPRLDGSHEIRQISVAPQINDTVTMPPSLEVSSPALQAGDVEDDGRFIDVLMLWTPAVESQYGSRAIVELVIDRSITSTNVALEASDVRHRYRLVGKHRVNFVESSTNRLIVELLAFRGDGVLDEAHTLREQYGADLVTLLNVREARGYLLPSLTNPAGGSAGFNTSFLSDSSVAHEIGHNMGLHHNPEDAESNPPLPYAYGYWDPSGLFRDVMSYWCKVSGRCELLMRYSNPRQTYEGRPLGRTLQDNARALNTTAGIIAAYRSSATLPPFGAFELPIDHAAVSGETAVTGWLLDDVGIERVEVWRDAVAGEPSANGLVYIGVADFVAGSRPDVAQAYPTAPDRNRAGWGYMLLTNMLPNSGNGTFRLHARGVDRDGHTVTIGTRTIVAGNATSRRPFGTIDTPAQGATVSGVIANFGWVLTPQPARIPTDGSTITVYVDNVPVGHPAYNFYRSDIATLFPGYANSNGAVGYFMLDTRLLADGVHIIAWVARDDQGNAEGLGSRFFTVANGPAGVQDAFEFAAGVSDADQELIRRGVSLGTTVAATEFGSARTLPARVVVRSTPGGGAALAASPQLLEIDTTHPEWTAATALQRLRRVLREAIHLWQDDRGWGRADTHVWLTEGVAEYGAFRALAQANLILPDTVRACHETAVVDAGGALPGLKGIATGPAFYPLGEDAYKLSFLAIEWSLVKVGPTGIGLYPKLRLAGASQGMAKWEAGMNADLDFDEIRRPALRRTDGLSCPF